jgi:hypothetical protein
MVKIGFIVEGESEEILIKSNGFRNYLKAKNIDFVEVVANVKGGGNLLPHKLSAYTQNLKDEGATHFIILTDLETSPSIEDVKKRINAPDNHILVISVKALEAWYLADSSMLSNIFKKNYKYEFPENTSGMPFDTLRAEFVTHTGRGFNSSKPKLAFKMLKEGFLIENAAKHDNCPSSKYFLEKLQSFSAI